MSERLRRNIVIRGHRTSINLERSIWSALENICDCENMNISQIIGMIDDSLDRDTSRTSAVRIFIVNYFRTMANDSKALNNGYLKLNSRNIKQLVNGPIGSR